MITSYQLFCEAISLSQAKRYTKLWYDSGADKLHADFFTKLFKGKPDTKYRLYYPFQIDNKEDKVVDSLETEITALLIDNGYSDVDYIGNKATDKYGRTVKISSVLSKLKQSELLNKYNANLNRSNKSASKSTDEYMIVISRHPVDLAGMSTKRGWTSCMDLDEGGNRYYVRQDVIYGTLIAYIIKSSDLNIENPIARCLIKPFTNIKSKIYVPEQRTYGTLSLTTQKAFVSFITKWCDDNLNIDSIDGKYFKHTNLYADSGFEHINKVTSLRKYLEDNYEVKDNTVVVDNFLLLTNANLKSLDTGGLKVILNSGLNIKDNPELTTLDGIENWDIKSDIYADWENIKGVRLRDIILYQYSNFITWIDDNTINIKKDVLELDSLNLKSIDTDGLKIILNGDLDIKWNPDLTSLDGIENWDVKGDIYAEWRNIKEITLREIILYRNKKDITWLNDNTIKIEGDLNFRGCGLTSLDTDGLTIIVYDDLDLTYNPKLETLEGLNNFKVGGNICIDNQYDYEERSKYMQSNKFSINFV